MADDTGEKMKRLSYFLTPEIVSSIKRLAKASEGTLNESDVVRHALKAGFVHVETKVIPALTGKAAKARKRGSK